MADLPVDRAARLAAYKHLTEVELPARASASRWPIRFDHCFKRICLDNACGDVWHRHIRRPAQEHIDEPYLTAAIQFGQRILDEGRPALEELNHKSLAWRGKSSGK
jgi:hypothetical protein